MSGNGEWTPRKVVLQRGIFTVERDSEGKYFLAVPDGKRESGLTLDELAELRRALSALQKADKQQGDPPPRTNAGR